MKIPRSKKLPLLPSHPPKHMTAHDAYIIELLEKVRQRTEDLTSSHAREIAIKNNEKDFRASEFNIIHEELAFQNQEKEKRTAELSVANAELIFQNNEKEKRAAELAIANLELIFQNEQKEQREAELVIANKELLAFNFISSHDLQEPLRKIQFFAQRILDTEFENLSDNGQDSFTRIHRAAKRMQTLIEDLLAYSQTGVNDMKFTRVKLNDIVKDVEEELAESIREKAAIIEAGELGEANVNSTQFYQLLVNLICNSLKFSKQGVTPRITVSSTFNTGLKFQTDNPALLPAALIPEKKYCRLVVSDNGVGFDNKYREKIFQVFQQLHAKYEYPGSGIGLAIVKKIIENHRGAITASSILGEGASFEIYIPE